MRCVLWSHGHDVNGGSGPGWYRLWVQADDIERWLKVGRARWPELAIEATVLVRHLERLAIDPAVAHSHVEDLYLACGCAHGLPAAIAVFERELMPIVRTAARRIDSATELVDEVAQAARERLLVSADSAEPRIAEYNGSGALAAWVRIAAMRIAMNLLRSRRRNLLVDDDLFFDELASQRTDAERRQIRARYAEACSQALREAFAALSARERNLLRMHHLHGLTIDELAPTFRVHRATVARWIERARETLLARTREELCSRLQIGAAEVDSILRELHSRLDVSVSRLLAE